MLYGFQHRNFRVVVTARCFKPLQLEVCRAFLEKWWRFLQEREVCRTVPRLSWRMKLVHLICAIFLIVKAKNPISVAYVYFGRNRFFGRWRKALTRLDEVNAKFVAQSKILRRKCEDLLFQTRPVLSLFSSTKRMGIIAQECQEGSFEDWWNPPCVAMPAQLQGWLLCCLWLPKFSGLAMVWCHLHHSLLPSFHKSSGIMHSSIVLSLVALGIGSWWF